MTEQQAIGRRIDALRNEINHHNIQYYVMDDPQVTDQHYDRLMRELQVVLPFQTFEVR